MAEQLFSNNAKSSLAVAVGSDPDADTTLSVQTGDGSLFPNPGANQFFLVTLQDTNGNIEICRCTARNTDSLTVVRGQEGFSARAWNAGDKIEARLTAGSLKPFDVLSLNEQGSDPPTTANAAKVFAKEVNGITELFGMADDGSVYQLTREAVEVPDGSTQIDLAFDVWRVSNEDRPVLVVLDIEVTNSGSSIATVEVVVDEAGGTIQDYVFKVYADADSNDDKTKREIVTFLLVAGGSYKVKNVYDPVSNKIVAHREYIL